MSLAALLFAASASTAIIPSTPDLGKAEGRCRANESGPSFLITVDGLKDRKGKIKAELYPDNDTDFLQDDNILVSAGKTFRRVEIDVPQTGPVELCIRAPAAGSYSLIVLHDRDSNRKIGISVDGVGVHGITRVCFRQPRAKEAVVRTGSGPTRLSIPLMYRRGLTCFGTLK